MNNFLKEKNISISILDVDNLEIFLISLSEFIKKNKLNDIVIHFDIMDGNFVPHYGVDLDLIKLVKKYKFFVDVHLMCSNPKEYIDKAIELGADNITVHYEIDNLYENLKYLNKIKEELSEKNKEFSIGISIKPDTDIKKIFNYSKMCDIILLMSVYPGLGGQSYMNKINKKIEIAKDMKKMVQVDGGVNDSTIIKPNSLGVNSFVIGSYITKDLNNMSEKIMKIENIIKGN
jgi:ribulose-phosphate 3-epimerase